MNLKLWIPLVGILFLVLGALLEDNSFISLSVIFEDLKAPSQPLEDVVDLKSKNESISLVRNRTLCTVLRNEARFVKEWIQFHHDIGFNNIVIYDDFSTDNIQQVLGTLPATFFNYRKVDWKYEKYKIHVQYALQQDVISKCFVRCLQRLPFLSRWKYAKLTFWQ